MCNVYKMGTLLLRNSLKEMCLIPFSSLEVRYGVALITYLG